jgi:hypothetical protein
MTTRRTPILAGLMPAIIFTFLGAIANSRAQTWTEKAAMATGRWGMSVVEHEGKLFAIGGSRSTERLATVEQYDPLTDKWTPRSDMPTARKDTAAAVVEGEI